MKKKIKLLIITTAILTSCFCMPAMAAPSPSAGTVSVVINGRQMPLSDGLKTPTADEMAKIGSFISNDAAQQGKIPSVKATVKIETPSEYKKGDFIPVVFAVSGLKNGASNVFAYILLPNGKIVNKPCTVKNGYVGFYTDVFGTVSIVELNDTVPASQVPLILH